MIRAAIGTSISVALLLLPGCAGQRPPVGTFRGERNLEIVPGTDPVVADGLRRVQLTIDEDGRGVFQESGVPFDVRVTRNGDDLNLEVLAVANVGASKQPPDLTRPHTFRLLPDGSLEGEGVALKRFP